jgi:two-component system, chemotaxis family, protein-glutamate methylesterase/glutaminase
MALAVTRRDIVVFGGSSGGLFPITSVLAALPRDLPASLFVVLHGGRESQLVTLLQNRSRLVVAAAVDDIDPERGAVYVAPHDHHLFFESGKVRVVRGPRENRARPSIDVLFRAAAVEFGSRVVAILLSGTLDDGVAGLRAVKRCGGTTIVQHPNDASYGELPQNAIKANVADHVATTFEMCEIVARLVSEEAEVTREIPEDLKVEVRHAALRMRRTNEVSGIGEQAALTCPECGGPMWQVAQTKADPPARFRCEIGHAFTTESFLDGQSHALEQALWIAFRTLKERSGLVRGLAEQAEQRGFTSTATRYREVIDDLEEHSETIKKVLSAATKPVPSENA